MTRDEEDTHRRRRLILEIVEYLRFKGFLRTESPEPFARCWADADGWMVLLSLRGDGTGFAGEVRRPGNRVVSTTSWVDPAWLAEKLP